MSKAEPTLYCSFCCKSQEEVVRLIQGPVALICNECITLCADIVIHEARQDALATAAAAPPGTLTDADLYIECP